MVARYGGSLCSLCLEVTLDPLGHHAVSCKQGGDAVTRHNQLRDAFSEACHRAHLPVRIEMGSGLTPDHSHSRPVDVLVAGWERGKPAAFDITVTSPLCPAFLGEASQVTGAVLWLQKPLAHGK